jgi:hypothetical protein
MGKDGRGIFEIMFGNFHGVTEKSNHNNVLTIHGDLIETYSSTSRLSECYNLLGCGCL